jgi:hypothetical protein
MKSREEISIVDKKVELLLHIDTNPEIENIENLEMFSRQLREELLELDVESVDYVTNGELLEGAKSGTPIDWNTLLLTFAASGGVITTIINLLQSWLARHDKRTIVLEIDGDKLEVTGISSKEQKQLIDKWLSRHRGFLVVGDQKTEK